MGKLRPGERLPGLPAGDWNRFHDAANQVLGAQRTGERPRIFTPSGGVYAYVKNGYSSDCPRFQALGIDGVETEPGDDLAGFKQFPVLSGDRPAFSAGQIQNLTNWVIAQETIEAGKVGLCCVSGLTICQINTQGSNHEWPYVSAQSGNFLPTEEWYGRASIIAGPWQDSGLRWALVNLGNFVNPIYQAIATTGISAGSSKSCQIFTGGTGKNTKTVYFDWMDDNADDISSGAELLVYFDASNLRWRVSSAECEP